MSEREREREREKCCAVAVGYIYKIGRPLARNELKAGRWSPRYDLSHAPSFSLIKRQRERERERENLFCETFYVSVCDLAQLPICVKMHVTHVRMCIRAQFFSFTRVASFIVVKFYRF